MKNTLSILFCLLYFNCLVCQDDSLVYLNSQEITIKSRSKIEHSLIKKVLPGVDLYYEIFGSTERSTGEEFRYIMYLNDTCYFPWQINDLISRQKSKDLFTIEDLIKAHIYLEHASINRPDYRWDTLDLNIINISEEINYFTSDSIPFNYVAKFDYGYKENIRYIYFIKNKEIYRKAELAITNKIIYPSYLKWPYNLE